MHKPDQPDPDMQLSDQPDPTHESELPTYQIDLDPSLIGQILASYNLLGVAYGEADAQTIAENRFAGYNFRVDLMHEPPQWSLVVKVQPLLDAGVRLRLPDRMLRGMFDHQGLIVFRDLPVEGLKEHVELTVEFEAGSN
ncbi:hypothetical protein [Candidatus Chloroploca asiatica]|uniref:Uncharacterized protein n=1 Tax=Candidatus Chloroploca asiatica TaxID=1506545 RepID=A0A2H3LBF6_9CHLR|nr:hypothetical protein [Candidatus Chloroploca asiatica]PDV99743.1 hypothetical protein A9Q02_00560 [Candidatus Chloroploca asiatica]